VFCLDVKATDRVINKDNSVSVDFKKLVDLTKISVEKESLLVYIDDATSKLMQLYFTHSESMQTYFLATKFM
jgi:hypothetical protein